MGINVKYLEALKNCELFNGVEEKVIRKLLLNGNVSKAKKNEMIFTKETSERKISIILKGKTITKTNDIRDKVILSEDEVSDIIGMSLVNPCNNIEIEVESLSNTVLLDLTQEELDELCLSNPQINKNLMNIMSKRIHWLLRRIKSFTAKSAEKKLALYLQDIMGMDNVLSLDVSMSKLAIMLDLGRASLYRAIDTLENNNVIIRNKKAIKVVDVKKLDKLCEE